MLCSYYWCYLSMPIPVDLDEANIECKVKDIISSTTIHLQGKGPTL